MAHQSRVRLKHGAQNSTWVSLTGWQGPSTWAICCGFPRRISRELAPDRKQSSWHRSGCSCGTSGGGLTYWAGPIPAPTAGLFFGVSFSSLYSNIEQRISREQNTTKLRYRGPFPSLHERFSSPSLLKFQTYLEWLIINIAPINSFIFFWSQELRQFH